MAAVTAHPGPSAAPVVVTGAAGFIGSHLVRRLRADGHHVVGIDAFRGTATPAVGAARLAGLADDPGFTLVPGDLLELELPAVLAGAHTVFHLAARPGARDSDDAALTRDNVDATAAVVLAAEAVGAQLVLASSSSVYGQGGVAGPCREDQAVLPLSHYGRTKRGAELLVLTAEVRTVIVRFFTVYGPQQRTDMAFARFIAAALDGRPAPLYQGVAVTRDYTYVGDAVEGLLAAWRRGVAPIYNISGGQVVDLVTAHGLIEALTGGEVRTVERPAPPQPSTTHADLTLARRDLGYEPAVDLREGLSRQVAEHAGVVA